MGCPPAQDASHHQDDIIFLVGNTYKPFFATVTGRGNSPRYLTYWCFLVFLFLVSGTFLFNHCPQSRQAKKMGKSADFRFKVFGYPMDVSENSGTPKSSILKGFSIINYPFWGTTIFGNTPLFIHISCPQKEGMMPVLPRASSKQLPGQDFWRNFLEQILW